MSARSALGFGCVAAGCVGARRGGAGGGAGGSRRPGGRVRVDHAIIRSRALALGSSPPGSDVQSSGNSFMYFFGCEWAWVRTCAVAVRRCSSMRGRELGFDCEKFRADCAVALLCPADAGVTSTRNIGAGMAHWLQDKNPRKIPCAGGGVKAGFSRERIGSSPRAGAMRQSCCG